MSVSNFFKSVQKIWNRQTLADGTLFDEEFGNLYSNFERIVDKGDLPVHNSAPAGSSVIHVTNQSTGQADSDGLRIEVGPSGEAIINQQESQGLIIRTNNSERVVIGSDGAVKVDTINERILNNGVNIEGLNIKDGEITGGGWIDARETWTFAGADSPTFTITTPGDKTAKYSTGMKLKLNQEKVLTSYWSFDSNLNDMVGANHGTAIGGATAVAGGKFNNGLTLIGSSQAVSINDAAILKPTGEFTLGLWLKTPVNGIQQAIFQSYSQNPNQSGFVCNIETNNGLRIATCKNTGLTVGVDTTEVEGKTNVCDNNWHYAVFTFRNNWGQIYLDGNLEASGYLFTPVYAATNYVRIGCHNMSGTNAYWFNGILDDIFFINGYALDEQTIKAKYLSATAQGTGNFPVTKNFFISASPVYSGGNTAITLYGGTDYTLTNGTITNPYYSMLDQPSGWQGNPAKWTVEVADSQYKYKSSPTAGTWYGGANAWTSGTNITVTMPVGIWELQYQVIPRLYYSTTGSYELWGYVTLSTNNNNESDSDLTGFLIGISEIGSVITIEKYLSIASKTIYYLLLKTDNVSLTTLYLNNNSKKAIIRAKFFKA